MRGQAPRRSAQPARAQAAQQAQVARVGIIPYRRLDDTRHICHTPVAHQRAKPGAANGARPDVGVGIAARAEGVAGVIEVHRLQPAAADDAIEPVEERAYRFGAAQVIAPGDCPGFP